MPPLRRFFFLFAYALRFFIFQRGIVTLRRLMALSIDYASPLMLFCCCRFAYAAVFAAIVSSMPIFAAFRYAAISYADYFHTLMLC